MGSASASRSGFEAGSGGDWCVFVGWYLGWDGEIGMGQGVRVCRFW